MSFSMIACLVIVATYGVARQICNLCMVSCLKNRPFKLSMITKVISGISRFVFHFYFRSIKTKGG